MYYSSAETNNVARQGQYEEIQNITQKIYESMKDVKDENIRTKEIYWKRHKSTL